jgi:hypothetical protein
VIEDRRPELVRLALEDRLAVAVGLKRSQDVRFVVT